MPRDLPREEELIPPCIRLPTARGILSRAPAHLRPPAWLRVLGLLVLACGAGIGARADDLIDRGAYLVAIGGCLGCHTDVAGKGPPFAGGRALPTPMGTFYGPNITPDPVHGIGAWTEGDVLAALRHGTGRGGVKLYPAFPYPSFTGITDEDVRAIKAYLFSVPAEAKPSKPHDLRFPFTVRPLMRVWNWLYFKPGPFKPDPARSSEWNRGAYLVEALGHCAECHTPRGVLGGLERSKAYSGTRDGPEGKAVPNITPDPETGIGKWSATDLLYFLETGILPDGDVTGSVMGEVVKNGTSRLTGEDRRAIATYLRDLAPIVHRIEPKTK